MALSLEIMSLRITLLAVLSAALAGCHAQTAELDRERVLPTPEQARAALSAALSAWKARRPSGSMASAKPAVEFVDSFRKPERPLRNFEILGPIDADRGRCFSVRLSIENPDEIQVVRYVVIGAAPIWVFRQEDFERISHWEHKMEEAEPVEPTSPAGGLPSARGAGG
jgi:hypothetical protein